MLNLDTGELNQRRSVEERDWGGRVVREVFFCGFSTFFGNLQSYCRCKGRGLTIADLGLDELAGERG